ncbi:MAG: hypothetical protein H7145_00280 [Akkermansiaceae bacterium]|nr:hypothetical protein [Armatimonadota bacterium]
MQILVEPTETGVRAQTFAPWNIAVEAATEQDALKGVYAKITERVNQGAKVIVVDEPTQAEDNPLRRLAGMFTESDEEFAAFQEEIRKYRRERDAEDVARDI